MAELEDLNKTPPSFPLLVNQARSIALEMIDLQKPLAQLDSTTRSKLALLISTLLHDSFWAGIHTLEADRSPDFNKCLESLYDQELQLYWQNFRKAKTPQLIRPVNLSAIRLDTEFIAKKQSDLQAIKELLTPFIIDNHILDLIIQNFSTLSDILALDASGLSDDYCKTQARLQESGKAPDMRALMFPNNTQDPSPSYSFTTKTAMISQNTFYVLTGLTVLSSYLFYKYSRHIENPVK